MAQTWHFVSNRQLPFLNYLLPAVTILIAQLLEVLPGQLFSGVMPFLGPAVLFYWGLYRPRYMPVWETFLLGLISDILFSPILGLHGLIYLLVRQVAVAQRRYLSMRNFTILWVTFAVMMAGVFIMHSFYMTTIGFDHDPLVFTKLTQTCFAFPLVYYIIARFHHGLRYEGWL